MIDIGDGIEVQVIRDTGAAERRPDAHIIAGMKIWPDGRVGVWGARPAFDFQEGRVEFKEGETLWELFARAAAGAKPSAPPGMVHVGDAETRRMADEPQPLSPAFDRAARDAARAAGLTEAEILEMYGPPQEDDK